MISNNIWRDLQGETLKILDKMSKQVYVIKFNNVRKEWEYKEDGIIHGVNEYYQHWKFIEVVKDIKTVLPLP